VGARGLSQAGSLESAAVQALQSAPLAALERDTCESGDAGLSRYFNKYLDQ
jgi:hypothetical protein